MAASYSPCGGGTSAVHTSGTVRYNRARGAGTTRQGTAGGCVSKAGTPLRVPHICEGSDNKPHSAKLNCGTARQNAVPHLAVQVVAPALVDGRERRRAGAAAHGARHVQGQLVEGAAQQDLAAATAAGQSTRGRGGGVAAAAAAGQSAWRPERMDVQARDGGGAAAGPGGGSRPEHKEATAAGQSAGGAWNGGAGCGVRRRGALRPRALGGDHHTGRTTCSAASAATHANARYSAHPLPNTTPHPRLVPPPWLPPSNSTRTNPCPMQAPSAKPLKPKAPVGGATRPTSSCASSSSSRYVHMTPDAAVHTHTRAHGGTAVQQRACHCTHTSGGVQQECKAAAPPVLRTPYTPPRLTSRIPAGRHAKGVTQREL